MKARSLLAAVLGLGLLLPGALAGQAEAAQEEEEGPQPGVVVIRYFQCDMGRTGEAIEMLNTTWREVVESVIEDGMLIDYGILTHNWGDEWNLMDYFVAENSIAFHEGWNEALSRIQERDPEGTGFETFTDICTRHKDNMWGVVSPPSEDEEGEDEASQ